NLLRLSFAPLRHGAAADGFSLTFSTMKRNVRAAPFALPAADGRRRPDGGEELHIGPIFVPKSRFNPCFAIYIRHEGD
ncbi:MAG: hypothetical protein J1F06_05975, partial [Prevotellaceae bacterium]|nr:hypothetical protein [Prevotellaceae bacterium]